MTQDPHKPGAPAPPGTFSRPGFTQGSEPRVRIDPQAGPHAGGAEDDLRIDDEDDLSDSDRRLSPRASMQLRVEYTKVNAFFADYTRNISHGGTFIRTDEPLPVGTVFMFRLVVPRLPGPIALSGQVRWVKRPGQPSPPGLPAEQEPGMGIRFIYDSPEQRAAVQETVEQLMIDCLGSHLYSKLMGKAP